MSTPETVKAQLQADIAAANATTGKADTTLHDAVNSLIEGFGSGEEELFFSVNGAGYTKNMVIPLVKPINPLAYLYRGAAELESIAFPNAHSSDASNPSFFGSSLFHDCKKLKKAYLPKVQHAGHYVFRGCTALEEVQVGSIGYPLVSLGDHFLTGCTQSNLTITVYVADDATLPFAKSPWGATNATIIYRSATTGEVIEV